MAKGTTTKFKFDVTGKIYDVNGKVINFLTNPKTIASETGLWQISTWRNVMEKAVKDSLRDGSGDLNSISEINAKYAELVGARTVQKITEFNKEGNPIVKFDLLDDFGGPGEAGDWVEETAFMSEEDADRWASEADRIFYFEENGVEEAVATELKTSRSQQAHSMNITFVINTDRTDSQAADAIKSHFIQILKQQTSADSEMFDFMLDRVYSRFTTKFVNLMIMDMVKLNRLSKEKATKGQAIGYPYVHAENIRFYRDLVYTDAAGNFDKGLFRDYIFSALMDKTGFSIAGRKKPAKEVIFDETGSKASDYASFAFKLSIDLSFSDYKELYKRTTSYIRTHSVNPNEATYPYGAEKEEIDDFDHLWQFVYAYNKGMIKWQENSRNGNLFGL